MAEGAASAFLSYTRLDDEFFGGSITTLRRMFELGVQVVTGDRTFSIFQDVDGIELGQKWQKRLDEAILESTFLIPIVTPLFFTSDPCRDELSKFVAHEKSLGVDDRILPIYFQTAPTLEKSDLLQKDALAQEVRSRQLYDWRDRALLPTDDLRVKASVLELATSIGEALSRVVGAPPVNIPPVDIRLREELTLLARDIPPQRESAHARTRVLWVDDQPDNNAIERRSLEGYNVDFVLATSTGEALRRLTETNFDVLISDMGRPGDSQAGLKLLDAVRGSGDQTPYFIYTGRNALRYEKEALRRGAQGITESGNELLRMVLDVVRR